MQKIQILSQQLAKLRDYYVKVPQWQGCENYQRVNLLDLERLRDFAYKQQTIAEIIFFAKLATSLLELLQCSHSTSLIVPIESEFSAFSKAQKSVSKTSKT